MSSLQERLESELREGLNSWSENTERDEMLMDLFFNNLKANKMKTYKESTLHAINYSENKDELSYPKSIRALATHMTNLPVANAHVERIFSQLKLLYHNRRLNLDQEQANEILFLGINNCIPDVTVEDLEREIYQGRSKHI